MLWRVVHLCRPLQAVHQYTTATQLPPADGEQVTGGPPGQ